MIESRKNVIKHFLNEADMMAFAGELAHNIRHGAVFYLQGPLGAGKTTFTRGFLNGMGYKGKVKSPTYTLIESYKVRDKNIHHFDFYRLHDTRELEYIGISEYFSHDAICLIEWPERGASLLRDADIVCHFSVSGEGRKLRIEALTERGERILGKL